MTAGRDSLCQTKASVCSQDHPYQVIALLFSVTLSVFLALTLMPLYIGEKSASIPAHFVQFQELSSYWSFALTEG